MSLIRHLVGAAQGKHPLGAARSSHWPTVRKRHLAANPCCAVCGGTEKLEVHHRQPFHLNPALELDPANLITLCEANKGGVNCHLFVGHLGSFKAFNPAVEADAAEWQQKMKTRPLTLKGECCEPE
jgi:5-methylcytosine-specific restriction enzyme A